MNDFTGQGVDGFGQRLGEKYLSRIAIDGVSISIFPGHPMETTIWASDATAITISELHFDLGEGPRWDAIRSRLPVSVPDLDRAVTTGWPVFAMAAAELEVGALFVFPMTLGAMDVGVVELYRRQPGQLGATELNQALTLAEEATWQILREVLTALPEPGAPPDVTRSALSRREIHQATGMVLAQTGGTATEALLIMRAHAFSQGQTVREVAHEVVTRVVNFSPTDGDPIPPSVK